MTRVGVEYRRGAEKGAKHRARLCRLIVAVVVLFGMVGLVSPAYGAGELDPTFDGDGMVLTDFGGADQGSGVAIQADGKIVAAGSSLAGPPFQFSHFDFALARYNPNGSLDSTFDGDGRVLTDFGATDVVAAVAIQADGKIVAVGRSFAGPNPDNFALARYKPNGNLDSTFDGDGRVLTDFGASDAASDVAIQADGRIVVAGTSSSGGQAGFELVRYNPDGSLDSTFDGDGRSVTDFGALAGANGLAIQADGRIVAAGTSGAGANPQDFALARYNTDGSLDPTFDGDGRVLTDLGGDELGWGVAIQTNGRIVVAGQRGQVNDADFALARYNPDGSLDPAFDGDGRVVTAFNTHFDAAQDVAIQPDGRIVAVGDAGSDFPRGYHDFALARYNPDGSLDLDFDGDGMVLTDFGAGAGALGVAIQANGRIVAAGDRFGIDFALARYLPGGVPANLPPDCSAVTANPNTLSPPNHALRAVNLSGATDPDGDTVILTIIAVTQDEPLNGPGDGDKTPDAQPGAQSNEVLVRAERSGKGDGRVYRVSFSGSDGAGGTCTGTATVGVPRSSGAAAIDSAPPSFNSFGP
jgi:uncharacterized delta-60 repeat protein